MKKKKTEIKKPKYKLENITPIIVLIAILVVALISSTYIFQNKNIITTTSTISATSTISPTTTISTFQTCSNFTWKIDSMEEFDLIGSYRILVVDFTAKFIGLQQQNYGWGGAFTFKILDSGGKYYNVQETYDYCDYSDRFQIGAVKTNDIKSGCLEFRVLDANKPIKLVFYDYIVNTMCEIDLP